MGGMILLSAIAEDVQITKRITEAAKLMDIIVHDHIIIGHNTYSSLKELGYIK